MINWKRTPTLLLNTVLMTTLLMLTGRSTVAVQELQSFNQSETELREQLSDSLLELSDQLGQLITESERQPGQDLRVEIPKSPLEQMREQVFQSRQSMNQDFETMQTEIDSLFRANQRRRERQSMQLETTKKSNGLTHEAGDHASLEVLPIPADASMTEQTPNGDDSSETETETETDPESPADQAEPINIDVALNKLADQQREQVQSSTAAKLVSGHAVNQLSLADNVFAAGDVRTAMKIYSQLLTEKHTNADLLWIKFQMAACYRRTQNYDPAERLLREITNMGGEDFPVPQARWWLATIGKRLREETDLQAIDTALQAFQKELINGANIER